MIPQFVAHRLSRRHALALVSAAIIGGCSLTPAYQRPAVAIPTTLNGERAAVAAPAPVASAHIRLNPEERRFAHAFAPDRDLVPLLEHALAHNTDFNRSVLQVAQARAQYRIQTSAQSPTVGMGAQRLKQHFDNPALDERYKQDLTIVNAGINDVELDFFGKLQAMSEAARQRYLASAYGSDAARGALIAEVLRAYVTERTAEQTQAQRQALDADSTALLGIAERQYQVGLIAHDELDAQRRQADQAHVGAMQAADDHAAARRALQILTGYDSAPVAGDLAHMVNADTSSEAWRALDSSLLLQRPDVRQAESELRAAKADIGAARAAFFPSITLSSSVGTASSSLTGLFSAGYGMWTFTPRLNLPLFDGGRNRANLTLAQARERADVASYEQTIQSAFREVADALDAHATAGASESRERAQSERERLRVQRMTRRVDMGLEDRTALLAERQHATQAELDYLAAARQRLLSRIALFQAFYGVSLPPAS